MKSRLIAVVAAITSGLLLTGGTVADPLSAAEHARLALAERTVAQALAAAAASEAAAVPVATEPEPEPVASGGITPGEPEQIEASQVGATVDFSGFKVDESLDVTVSELSDAASDTAASEYGGTALSAPIDISAETGAGEDVTEFPVDAVIEKAPDGTPIVTEVTPGVALEMDVDLAALEGLDPSSLRIVTREEAGEPWVEIPSYFDVETGTVKGEIDHLSQFVVIGTAFVPPPGPRIVLDPDDDVGHTEGPGGPMTELPQNVALANQLAEALTEGCLADVKVTRTSAAPPVLTSDVRAGMAANHNPDLTITLAFNALNGFPWGEESDGGSLAFSRGGAQDDALAASLVAQLPGYTGRPAAGSSSEYYPYEEFDGLPGAVAHLETLFIDHNYDRPVIDNGFDAIVNGVFTGIGVYLESQGFDCTDPKTGGWPARPSEAELAKWRNLGYQNYLTYGADPVSFSTGNLLEDEPIFSLSGVGGQQLDLALIYNSQDGRLTRTGAGWNFGLTAHAQRFDDGSVLVVRGDGASFVFEPNGAAGYDGEDGLHLTLTEAGDGRLLLSAVDGETWLFDAGDEEGIGELAEHTDRQGNSYTLTYATPDEDDQFVPLVSITDEAGQVVAIGHDALGRISTFTHPDGRIWSLSYDTAGNLVGIGGPDGRARTFTYDDAHQLLSATDPAGITYLVNEYDEQGRVVKQWDADENLRTFDYDTEPGEGGQTTYTDNEGNDTVFAFDEKSRITAVTDAVGQVKHYEYDDDNQVTAFIDEAGHRWEYEYDGSGNVVAQTAPDGTVTAFTYTPTGEVASVTDEGGPGGVVRSTSYQVDARGLTTGVTRPDGAQLSNVFDAHGDLTQAVDAAGGTTSFAYDERGNLISQTDPLGRTTTFAYDAANRVSSATDPAGGVTTFAWDAGDRLTSQTDALGGVTSFTYDANDHPITVTGPDGVVTTYAWDALFRMVSVTSADGAVTSYKYNTEDELVKTVDALGHETTLTLDDLYRPTTVTDANGGAWKRSYDPVGNTVTATDPVGAVTSFAYDDAGRLVATTDPLGAVSATAYDEVGRPTVQTDPLGNTVAYEYDVLDRLVGVTDQAGETAAYGYDVLGNLTTQLDRRGHSTDYTYDAVGQLLSWTGPQGTGATFAYDSRGNTLSQTDALGRTSTLVFDALSRPVASADPLGNTSTVAYDSVGRVVSAADPNGHATGYDYDLAGRLVESIDPLGASTTYAYDLLGRRTSTTDPNGTTTAYAFDALSQLTAVTEAAVPLPAPSAPDVNVTTQYTYDAVGDLTKVTDPNGAVSTFAYDQVGRTVSETNPLGKTWRYEYDLAGRTTREVDAKNQTTAYSYTARSDVSAIDYASGPDTTFTYDAEQNLIAMTDALGASGWSFDDAGRMTSQTDSLGSVLDYEYDATGAQTALTLPGGQQISYEYDDAGRPISQSSPWGELAYGYDAASNLTGVLRSTGVTSEYTYDADNRVTGITHTSPGAELGCDLAGNDIEIGVGVDIQPLIDLQLCLTVDLDIPVLTGLDYGDTIDLDYSYDPAGNLTGQTRTDGSASAVSTTYQYDRLDRLTKSTAPGAVNSYGYDKAGNRTTWQTRTTPTGAPTQTTTAAYNLADQLTSEVKARPGLLGQVTSTTNYTYDDNGNRTKTQTGGTSTTYSYTPDDKLAKVTQSGRTVTTGYDGLGRALTEKTQSLLFADTTQQVWDGYTVVQQDTGEPDETSLVRDVTGAVAIQTGQALLGPDNRWALTDRLGSTIAQTQGSRVSQTATYSDWGTPTFATAGWNSETGYTGELGDQTTGLQTYYARAYEPATATWLSADPYRGTLGNPSSQNRYGYVEGNPTTYVDYLGYRSNAVIGDWAKPPISKAKATEQTGFAVAPIGDDNQTSKRHGPTCGAKNMKVNCGTGPDLTDLTNVLDGISTVTGFAAFIPGPQQAIFAAISALTGAASSFIRCATNGILSPDCIIDIVFAALGPIGKSLKSTVGPMIKQAIKGADNIAAKAPPPPKITRPPTGGAGPVRVGQAGEQAVRDVYDIGDKVPIDINGRKRILDGLNDQAVTEIKNVKNQPYTQQLKDSLDYAEQHGLEFDLYVRPDTHLTKPLEDEVRINVKEIP